jgi:aspartyl-tRNA(Asn)/glutamyl-tRNA(Gln) amidotransferase subunit C
MEHNDIQTLAALARLRFTPGELRDHARAFEKMLAFVDQLSALDTDGVPADDENAGGAALRADVPLPTLSREKVLQNAPLCDESGFLIPKVL